MQEIVLKWKKNWRFYRLTILNKDIKKVDYKALLKPINCFILDNKSQIKVKLAVLFAFLLYLIKLSVMINTDKEKYLDILNESVTYLENRGYENIKAETEGYEIPKSFSKVGSNINITPDIVAEKDGQRHYFELSLKSEEPKLLKSKWLFLNALSALKSHRFRLITTKGHYKFTSEMMSELNLNDKNLIKI